MKIKELEYSRLFNLENYENERIGLVADLDETEDLDENFRTLKAKVFHLHEEGKLIEDSKKAVKSKKIKKTEKTLKLVQEAFSQSLTAMLFFEESQDAIIIKPRRFLGSDNFAKVASIVRELGGEYVSAGKKSHFKIPKNGKTK